MTGGRERMLEREFSYKVIFRRLPFRLSVGLRKTLDPGLRRDDGGNFRVVQLTTVITCM